MLITNEFLPELFAREDISTHKAIFRQTTELLFIYFNETTASAQRVSEPLGSILLISSMLRQTNANLKMDPPTCTHMRQEYVYACITLSI